MFYHQVLLTNKGKWCLVWLAATKAKILTKKEIISCELVKTCESIQKYVCQEGSARMRLSLYLSSNLVYGTAVILKRKASLLLDDLQAMRIAVKTYSVEQSTGVIDFQAKVEAHNLLILDPALNFNEDPFFGRNNDNQDPLANLDKWDEEFITQHFVRFPASPIHRSLRPQDIRSPHSVSDPREIQILEAQILEAQPISIEQIPDNELLPMDQANMEYIHQTRDDSIYQNSTQANTNCQHSNALSESMRLPPNEATLASPTAAGDPAAPRKPRQRRRHSPTHEGPGTRRRRIHSDQDQTDALAVQEPPTEPALVSGRANEAQAVSDQALTVVRSGDAGQLSEVAELTDVRPQTSPCMTGPEQGLDSHSKQLPIALPTIDPSPSPLRRRRPHKLIIDETITIDRNEMKENLKTGKTTLMERQIPLAKKGGQGMHSKAEYLMKHPGSNVGSSSVWNQWFRNSEQFALKDQTDSEASQGTPSPPSAIVNLSSRQKSIDLARDTSADSRRNSMLNNISLARIADQSINNDSSSRMSNVGNNSTINEVLVEEQVPQDGANLMIQTDLLQPENLPAIQEEQRLHTSAEQELGTQQNQNTSINAGQDLPLDVADQYPELLVESDGTRNTSISSDKDSWSSKNTSLLRSFSDPYDPDRIRSFLNKVRETVAEHGDGATFRLVLPPASTTRDQAAAGFSALLELTKRKKIIAKQDKEIPFDDIYLKLTDTRTLLELL